MYKQANSIDDENTFSSFSNENEQKKINSLVANKNNASANTSVVWFLLTLITPNVKGHNVQQKQIIICGAFDVRKSIFIRKND